MSVMQMRETSPALYEDRILKRGQRLLWYSSISCFCVSDNGRVQPNCPKCFGSGYILTAVKQTRLIVEGTIVNETKIDLSSRSLILLIINSLTIKANTNVPISSFTNDYIIPTNRIPRGTGYRLDCNVSLEKSYTGVCSYVGKNLITVPVGDSNTQGFFRGSLTSITSIYNETKEQFVEVESYWSNEVLISSVVENTDVLTIICKYVLPMTFLISNIDPKVKKDNTLLQESDLQMTFPGTYDIGRGDIFVLLTAAIKESMSAINEGASYKLPYFKVAKILRIEDRYQEITDYTFVRDNEIVWGSYRPKRFSISFTYCPTFAVQAELPNIRTSEDKLFPKKVYLKKFAMFSLSERVLQDKEPNESEIGILDDSLRNTEQGGLI